VEKIDQIIEHFVSDFTDPDKSKAAAEFCNALTSTIDGGVARERKEYMDRVIHTIHEAQQRDSTFQKRSEQLAAVSEAGIILNGCLLPLEEISPAWTNRLSRWNTTPLGPLAEVLLCDYPRPAAVATYLHLLEQKVADPAHTLTHDVSAALITIQGYVDALCANDPRFGARLTKSFEQLQILEAALVLQSYDSHVLGTLASLIESEADEKSTIFRIEAGTDLLPIVNRFVCYYRDGGHS